MGAGGPSQQPTSGHTESRASLTHSANMEPCLGCRGQQDSSSLSPAGLQLWMRLGLTEKGPFEKIKEALCCFYHFPLSLKEDKTYIMHF